MPGIFKEGQGARVKEQSGGGEVVGDEVRVTGPDCVKHCRPVGRPWVLL